MIDLNFKRFTNWSCSFVFWSDILEFVYKRHTGCSMMLWFCYFSLFLWLLVNGMKNAAPDFVMIYRIHWTERQVWTCWRRYWYYYNLKKKKYNYSIKMKLKREGIWTSNIRLLSLRELVSFDPSPPSLDNNKSK